MKMGVGIRSKPLPLKPPGSVRGGRVVRQMETVQPGLNWWRAQGDMFYVFLGEGELGIGHMRVASFNFRYCKNAKNEQKNSSFRSTFGLFSIKTTSLSGHHSRFGTTCSDQRICHTIRQFPPVFGPIV